MALNANNIVETTKPKKTSPYLRYGINETKINDITFKEASTGSLQMIYHMETAPVTEEGFVPADGASGQVGKVQTSYIKPGSEQESKEFAKLIHICKTAGLDASVYSGDFNTIEDFVKHILPHLKGKYVRYKMCAEFYWGKDAEGAPKERYILKFPMFKDQMCESVTVEASKSKLRFDENSQYDMDRRNLQKTADVPADPESAPW